MTATVRISNLDPAIPWCVGTSYLASQYMFANRDEADRMVAHLNGIDRARWSVRHCDEILAAKLAAQNQKAS